MSALIRSEAVLKQKKKTLLTYTKAHTYSAPTLKIKFETNGFSGTVRIPCLFDNQLSISIAYLTHLRDTIALFQHFLCTYSWVHSIMLQYCMQLNKTSIIQCESNETIRLLFLWRIQRAREWQRSVSPVNGYHFSMLFH